MHGDTVRNHQGQPPEPDDVQDTGIESEDRIDEAARESFPASDPPAQSIIVRIGSPLDETPEAPNEDTETDPDTQQGV